MSKHKNTDNTQTTQSTQTTQNLAASSPSAGPPPQTVEASIVTASPIGALAPHAAAAFAKFPSLPEKWLAYLDTTPPPARGEVAATVSKLSEEKRTAFQLALKRMNPVKIGQHTADTGTRFPEIHIYQGMGSNELRPADASAGSLYTSDGRVLTSQKGNLGTLRHNPKYKNLGESVAVYVLGIVDAHTFWQPKTQTIDLPEGVRAMGAAPICRSLDRAVGDTFGNCDTCEYRPFKNSGSPDLAEKMAPGCRREVHLFVVPVDFSGVYRLNVHGVSLLANKGVSTIKKQTGPWPTYWAQAFELSLAEIVMNKNRVFELHAAVVDGFEPSETENELLSLLARQVDYEVTLPAINRIYATPHKSSLAAPVNQEVANYLIGGLKDEMNADAAPKDLGGDV